MRGASKKRMLFLCVAVGVAGVLAGCASTSETSTLQENLSILNQREAALEKRVQGTEGASRRSGDLYAQMQQLEAQIRSLNGRIDEVQHKVDEMEQRQAPGAGMQPPAAQQPPGMPPSGTVIMQPPASGGAPPASAQPYEPPRNYAPAAPGAAGNPPPQSLARPAPVTGRNAEQIEFNRGVQLLQQNKFEAAKAVFQKFVSRYPNSGLRENALYNIGECSFGERHYEDAIKAFQAVVDRYPKGGKTASALLKEGIGWQEIGESTMARIIYTRLVTNYPGTAQAQAAQKRLKTM